MLGSYVASVASNVRGPLANGPLNRANSATHQLLTDDPGGGRVALCLFSGRGRGDGGFYQRSFDDVEGFGRGGREMHRSQSWEERLEPRPGNGCFSLLPLPGVNECPCFPSGATEGSRSLVGKTQVGVGSYSLALSEHDELPHLSTFCTVCVADAAPGHFQMNHGKRSARARDGVQGEVASLPTLTRPAACSSQHLRGRRSGPAEEARLCAHRERELAFLS